MKKLVKVEEVKVHYPIIVNLYRVSMLVHVSEENIKIEFLDMNGTKTNADYIYTP